MNKLNHVAFIMDGNGRWGQQRNKGRNFGHFNGVKTVKKIVEKSIRLKIPIITFYVFSTENWKRPKTEINFLFQLIINYFKEELNRVILNGIKVNIIGKLNRLPKKIKTALRDVTKKTKKNKKITVNLAINYGSRDEIVEACKRIKNKVNVKTLSKNLYTKNIVNPDILIRTGGHKRLSNFMLWQLAYTEIYFLDKLWPDFNGRDFEKITNNFKKVKRNFGSI
ncbi:MAG: di-trans,poly-cis-decaprenylcistransferase [Candidatus Pelagibacter sp. TMED263]|nr:MAG: di-trans,poly-cis-decaprenylcistransferase [Candidatus Pelagibacter sp. TMED263]